MSGRQVSAGPYKVDLQLARICACCLNLAPGLASNSRFALNGHHCYLPPSLTLSPPSLPLSLSPSLPLSISLSLSLSPSSSPPLAPCQSDSSREGSCSSRCLEISCCHCSGRGKGGRDSSRPLTTSISFLLSSGVRGALEEHQ